MNKGANAMTNEDTRQYWEDYVTYWLEKVKESNENSKEKKDTTVDDELLYTNVARLDFQQGDQVLDYGCGFCRLYPFIKGLGENKVTYFGVDIAQSPLDYAVNLYPELKPYLKTLNNERIPYEKDTFDKLVCFGVLDACHQEETIFDILKVLKTGGKALITGKNNNYHSDDELAITAEINARKKGHPNFFTDVRELLKQLEERDVHIEQGYYFERRGDSVQNNYTTIMPENFYEFFVIISKTKEVKEEFSSFSYKYSKTYCDKYPEMDR